jgi:hypothetical protein
MLTRLFRAHLLLACHSEATSLSGLPQLHGGVEEYHSTTPMLEDAMKTFSVTVVVPVGRLNVGAEP